jgi:hypothetical protein
VKLLRLPFVAVLTVCDFIGDVRALIREMNREAELMAALDDRDLEMIGLANAARDRVNGTGR